MILGFLNLLISGYESNFLVKNASLKIIENGLIVLAMFIISFLSRNIPEISGVVLPISLNTFGMFILLLLFLLAKLVLSTIIDGLCCVTFSVDIFLSFGFTFLDTIFLCGIG